MKEQANNKQKSGERKEKEKGIYKINNHRIIYIYIAREIQGKTQRVYKMVKILG